MDEAEHDISDIILIPYDPKGSFNDVLSSIKTGVSNAYTLIYEDKTSSSKTKEKATVFFECVVQNWAITAMALTELEKQYQKLSLELDECPN